MTVFVRSFVRSSIRPFVRSFVLSFVCSLDFVRSFDLLVIVNLIERDLFVF